MSANTTLTSAELLAAYRALEKTPCPYSLDKFNTGKPLKHADYVERSYAIAEISQWKQDMMNEKKRLLQMFTRFTQQKKYQLLALSINNLSLVQRQWLNETIKIKVPEETFNGQVQYMAEKFANIPVSAENVFALASHAHFISRLCGYGMNCYRPDACGRIHSTVACIPFNYGIGCTRGNGCSRSHTHISKLVGKTDIPLPQIQPHADFLKIVLAREPSLFAFFENLRTALLSLSQ